MCYVIAASLFEECTRANRTELFCLSVQTLLHCLAMFDRCMNSKSVTGSSKVQNPEQVMNVATLTALTWMENWQYNWGYYMENILMVLEIIIIVFKVNNK
jgi:hypothetical protein